MDPQVTENIREWIRLDDQHRTIKDRSKKLVDRKTELEDLIKTYVKDHKLANAQINVNDGSLRFVEKKTTSGLSMKFLKEQLLQFFKEAARQPSKPINAEEVYAYVIGNRKESVALEMVREIVGGNE